jgi:hypothetical protein
MSDEKPSAARQRFLDIVRSGSDRPYVSLQIGAGAGFDAKLAGKEWISEATLADTIAAYQQVGGDPLLNVGLPEFTDRVPELSWQHQVETHGEARVTHSYLDTPYGQLYRKIHENKTAGITPMVHPLDADSSLDVVAWYARQHYKALEFVPELIGPILEQAHPHGPVSIQWNVQPFELFGLASVPDLVLLAMTQPEAYRSVCDEIRDVNIELVKKVYGCGADFVFLGGPGVEMMSPKLYEEFLIPDSQAISKAAHEAGGLIYSHICSPVEPFLTRGFYNRMGIDLFETLSPPPVGNVEDLNKAREICDSRMCTRGNVGLDVLLNGSKEQVAQATEEVIKATEGSKHMVAASDYLFYDIPLENAQTIVETVQNYAG